MVVPGQIGLGKLRDSHLNSQHFCWFLGVKSGVGKQPDKKYVFSVFLGSIFGEMGVCGGPGANGPWKTEIFTPQFTPIGLF